MSSYNFQNDYNIPAFLRRSKKVGVQGVSQALVTVAPKNHQVVVVEVQTVAEHPPVPKLLIGPSK